MEEQIDWIDSLDTKAGILLSGDGIVASLVFARDSLLASAPTGVAVGIAILLVGSLVVALAAFGTRNHATAPNPTVFLALVTTHTEEALKWATLNNVLQALEINEPKIARKAAFLFWSGAALLVAILLFGAYFLWLLFN